MAWTQEKPLVAGKYWYASGAPHQTDPQKKSLTIVAIRPDDNGNLVALLPGIAGSTPIETLNGAWSGPVTAPAL